MRFCRKGGGADASPRLSARLIGAAAAALLGAAGLARAEPFLPSDDATVLERLPDAQDAEGRALRAAHRRLAADPRNPALAIDVATAELERGRTLADPRHLGRAEAALAPWAREAEAPPRIALLHAILQQSVHRFDAARDELTHVLAREPGNAQAWLMQASIATVQADYPAALAACGQVAAVLSGLAPATCTASVMSLTGHARLALAALQIAMADATAEPVPVRLWANTVAAETAMQLGARTAAEASFRAALALVPDDAYTLGAYADFLLDQGRPAEVVALLRTRTRVDPLLLRLALAEAALGMPEAAAHVADLTARFATSRLRGETIHQREEARFTLHLLHDAPAALRLAQANWQVQHEPADARILLEAANAAGNPEAAGGAIGWMRRNGVEDVGLAKLLPAGDSK